MTTRVEGGVQIMEERIRLNPLSHVSANVGGEELDEAPGGPLAGARDHRGEDLEAGAVEVRGGIGTISWLMGGRSADDIGSREAPALRIYGVISQRTPLSYLPPPIVVP